jgi:hypothetical protein
LSLGLLTTGLAEKETTMAEPIDLVQYRLDKETALENRVQKREGAPSNAVYARVGDTILCAARDGVQRNLPAKEIVREIREEHHVRLSVGELRLLLASRRVPETHHNSLAGRPTGW